MTRKHRMAFLNITNQNYKNEQNAECRKVLRYNIEMKDYQLKRIKRIPVTKEGFEKLQQALKDLQESRPEAVRNLANARAMGDLSENGLYTAAKSRLRSIDAQIFRTEIQIKLADIAETVSKDIVSIGSKVRIDANGVSKDINIVGDYESNPFEGKISQYSPLGKALMGKKKGETAEFNAPSGKISYKIVSIS